MLSMAHPAPLSNIQLWLCSSCTYRTPIQRRLSPLHASDRQKELFSKQWHLYAGYKDDKHTGKTIFGYVADACADDNYWCRNSQGHVDISTEYLKSQGLLTPSWNGRKITWDFVSEPPRGFAAASIALVMLDAHSIKHFVVRHTAMYCVRAVAS